MSIRQCLAILYTTAFFFGFFFSLSYFRPDLQEPIDDFSVRATESPDYDLSPPLEIGRITKHKEAIVTAYSCLGITSQEQQDMNCPSLRYSERGRTADGSEPIPYKTVACDRSDLGKSFVIDGVGEVRCTDTGGAIRGEGRFDLYVGSIHEARQWGVQERVYREIQS